MNRDLRVDLEICNKATEGPWEHKYGPEFSEIYANNSSAPLAIVGRNPHDADFIACARDGWPHAIERAIETELLVRDLTYCLEETTEILSSCLGARGPWNVEARAHIDRWSDLVAKAKEHLDNG